MAQRMMDAAVRMAGHHGAHHSAHVAQVLARLAMAAVRHQSLVIALADGDEIQAAMQVAFALVAFLSRAH